MKAKEAVYIELTKDAEFLFYLHDRGEEYFMPYDALPGIPNVYHVDAKAHHIEVDVKKEVEIANNNCIGGVYNYYG